ncbi:MAG: hypothetical protein IMW86_07300 [Hydrogenibacillus sp.]|nr:hypothetical protein [Hydrogenibacillus sp.]
MGIQDDFDLDHVIAALTARDGKTTGRPRLEAANEKAPAERAAACDPLSRAFDPETRKSLRALCNSKAEELRMLGLEGVTGDDVWRHFAARYARGVPPLYRVVGDILALRANEFMTAATLKALRDMR